MFNTFTCSGASVKHIQRIHLLYSSKNKIYQAEIACGDKNLSVNVGGARKLTTHTCTLSRDVQIIILSSVVKVQF